ncbi:MAG: hypothetical protein ACTS6G_02625 [Candidatus Hodgkinia cicadicola]
MVFRLILLTKLASDCSLTLRNKALYNRNIALKYLLNGNIIDTRAVVELLPIVQND